MIRQQKLLLAISEAVIPLLGFFFFEWGLYFILLFYFLDLFTTEVFLHVKAKKIIDFNAAATLKKPWLLFGLTSIFIAISTVFISHIVMRVIAPEISFYEECITFLMYEEAGVPIAQGYILLPLVFLGNFQQHKLFFLMPAKYRVLNIATIFKARIRALLIALLGAFIALGLAFFTPIHELIYLLLLVGVKFFVDFKMRV
jgi:hypothetical protein